MRHAYDSVTVTAPGRLHLGFLDLHAGLGRRFGSLGLALGDLATRVCLRPAHATAALGRSAARAMSVAERILDRLGIEADVEIEVQEALPEHAGLGSGTQLDLAVSAGIVHLFGLDTDVRSAAALIDRGQRSGIGIAAFEQGGFLVDGGRGPATETPPLIARLPFPEAWRVMLIFDDAGEGLHGIPERQAFRDLPPMAPEVAGGICRRVLMQILPALVEEDFDGYCAGIAEIQAHIGDYFAPAQGGRFASPRVGAVLDWLLREGCTGIGQSSWGPTGFAFLPTAEAAAELLAMTESRWKDTAGLRFSVHPGRNTGADIRTCESSPGALPVGLRAMT